MFRTPVIQFGATRTIPLPGMPARPAAACVEPEPLFASPQSRDAAMLAAREAVEAGVVADLAELKAFVGDQAKREPTSLELLSLGRDAGIRSQKDKPLFVGADMQPTPIIPAPSHPTGALSASGSAPSYGSGDAHETSGGLSVGQTSDGGLEIADDAGASDVAPLGDSDPADLLDGGLSADQPNGAPVESSANEPEAPPDALPTEASPEPDVDLNALVGAAEPGAIAPAPEEGADTVLATPGNGVIDASVSDPVPAEIMVATASIAEPETGAAPTGATKLHKMVYSDYLKPRQHESALTAIQKRRPAMLQFNIPLTHDMIIDFMRVARGEMQWPSAAETEQFLQFLKGHQITPASRFLIFPRTMLFEHWVDELDFMLKVKRTAQKPLSKATFQEMLQIKNSNQPVKIATVNKLATKYNLQLLD